MGAIWGRDVAGSGRRIEEQDVCETRKLRWLGIVLAASVGIVPPPRGEGGGVKKGFWVETRQVVEKNMNISWEGVNQPRLGLLSDDPL